MKKFETLVAMKRIKHEPLVDKIEALDREMKTYLI